MDINGGATPTPWHRRPGPTLVAGIALLALCAVAAVLWITQQAPLARAAGLVTGSAGLYLTYGAVIGLREGRAR